MRERQYLEFFDYSRTEMALDIPIAVDLPEGFLYQPALSCVPDNAFKLNRLMGVHHFMSVTLYELGYLASYQNVLGLHERDDMLIVVVDSRASKRDQALICQGAVYGWTSMGQDHRNVELVPRVIGKRACADQRSGPVKEI